MYASIQELKLHMNLDSDTDDLWLDNLLDGASKKIDRFCNRSQDGFEADTAATARYYPGTGLPYQFIHECVEVDSVAVKDSPSDDEDSYTAWTVGIVGTTTEADVFPASGDPQNPTYTELPYTFLIVGANGDYSQFTSGEFVGRGGFKPSFSVSRGLPTVEVTAKWGYAVRVPDDVKLACIMQSARWYRRVQSAMADSEAIPDMGRLMYQRALDPDIKGILVDGGYVKPRIGRPL